ncbi:MAG: dTMP kinase [Alphaproteobacteria bacterium]
MSKQIQSRFITLEGGEGVGKSTQIALLVEALENAGIKTLCTREPGGTPSAEDIRALFVKGAVDRFDALSELFLILAARRDHWQRKIRPALEAGTWVICDRWLDSTKVYQGIVKGLDLPMIEELSLLSTDGRQPDLTLVLDMPVEMGLARAGERNDDETRFEEMGLSFHQKIQQGFFDLLQKGETRYQRIDAQGTVTEISQKIFHAIEEKCGITL